MIDNQEFLDVIFGEIDEDKGEYICVSRAMPKRDGNGMWFKNGLETDRGWKNWTPEKVAAAWYYNVSSISGELNAKGTMVSRGRADLQYYYVLVLDDIGQKTDAPDVEPTYKLESSIGSFQWGYALIKGNDFALYEAVLQAIHEKGYGDNLQSVAGTNAGAASPPLAAAEPCCLRAYTVLVDVHDSTPLYQLQLPGT